MNRTAVRKSNQRPKTTKTKSLTIPKRSITTKIKSTIKPKRFTNVNLISNLSSTTIQSRSFSTETVDTTSVTNNIDDSPVQFPKTMFDRTFTTKVPMPFARGQAWGQQLVTNQQLPTPQGTWTPTSKRSGVIFTKVGMLSMYDQYGMRHGVTILDIDNCQVLRTHTKPNRFGQLSIEIGGHNKHEKNLTKPLLGHFHRARVQPKQFVRCGIVTPDATLPVGWEFDVRHFMVGQYVDVFGQSKGKGFQGVMKRYGFGGQPATHGVSVTHRSLGSTGCRQDPGKVFKNQKMPGQMGLNNICFENVRIFKIDPQRQLIYVKGMIPGEVGTHVYLRDAQKKPFSAENQPPFPTFVPPADDAKEILQIPNELLGPDPYAGGKCM